MRVQNSLNFISHKVLGKTINVILAASIIFAAIPVWPNAKTIQEIQQEIEKKKQEIDQISTDIQKLETDFADLQSQLNTTTDKRKQLQLQISIHQKETDLIKKQIEDLDKQKNIIELERQETEKQQDDIVLDSYIDWKQDNILARFLDPNAKNILKYETYDAMMAGRKQTSIQDMQIEINQINEKIKDSENEKIEYEKKLQDLDTQIQSINAELNTLNTKVNANKNDTQNYRARQGKISQEIDQLTQEQKLIQEMESKVLGTSSNGGTKQVLKGEMYFEGLGREAYQGHGVGMSQFGALGAALKGWDYKKILEFYYPGAKVVEYGSDININVDGHGSMNIEQYVAGAGEVPDYACEDLGIEFDPSNIWACWPKESIKAQAVAFRTYGLNRTKGGGSICTSAKCQVYKGGENKRWASDETKGIAIVYDAQPISAYYSSDNNNGVWGTANNETVWSDMTGAGKPIPYLRGVNDSHITYQYIYTKWNWRTNGYKPEDFDRMIEWAATSPEVSQGTRDFVSAAKSNIGSVQSFEIYRDPSGRVSRINIIGTNGSQYFAGWLFKSIWNLWVSNETPTGEKDYIYSTTFYLKEGS